MDFYETCAEYYATDGSIKHLWEYLIHYSRIMLDSVHFVVSVFNRLFSSLVTTSGIKPPDL